jgi:2'-5' RNA ligase
MRTAVTLPLDKFAANTATALMRRLADAGLGRDMLDLGYPPHLTLGIWPSADGLAEAVERLARRPPIAVQFAGLAVFPGNPAVLWLAPAGSGALLRLHASLAQRCPGAEPHYEPEAWVPHVTLSQQIADSAAALAVASAAWAPFTATLDRLEIVTLAPLRVVERLGFGYRPRR